MTITNTSFCRKICLAFFFSFLCAATHAQLHIKGFIKDSTEVSIPGCSVKLTSGTDINFAQTTSTDKDGAFKISHLQKGVYNLTITNVVYNTLSIKINLTNDTNLNIKLTERINSLSKVTITGNKRLLERKRDRFVFNVSNSPFTLGNNVFEVLRQTPMVQLTDQGALNILGNPQNATVFINRKKFPLSGEDLANFLKNMPADNILQIEILSIPPPYYDVNGPVIDIILKHLDINGIRGSTSLAYERASVNRGILSNNLDFNSNRYNQTLSIGLNDGDYFKTIGKTTNFYGAQPSTVTSDVNTRANRKGINIYTDLRYSLTPVLTIGTQLITNNSKTNSNGDGAETIEPAAINSNYLQVDHVKNNLLSNNAFLKYNSEKKQTYFELSTDYLKADMDQNNRFNSNLEGGNYQNISPQHIRNYAIKTDFSKPVFAKVLLTSGLRYSNSTINTPYQAFDLSNNQIRPLDEFSADFHYSEKIYSGYSTLERDFGKKWSAKIGLQAEHSHINTETRAVTLQANKQDYTFIFPLGYLNYSPDDNNSFSLTSKINNSRPGYSYLNPARRLIGSRTITEGNPYLNPSNGGIVELMYSLKQTYYWGLTYTQNNRLFSQINQVINQDTLLIKWQNWGNQKQYNFWFFTQHNMFNNHWSASINTNLGYYHRSYNTSITNSAASNSNVQLFASLNNSFSKIGSKNLSLYCNMSFNTPGRYGLWKDNTSSYRVDLGANYNVPKSNFRLSLAVNDLLKYNDRHVYNINQTDDQYTRLITNSDARSVRLTISKTFGNLKVKKIDKRNTSNEDEKQRIK